MGSPYLNANESIILATHRIMVKSVSSDVILTNQRLIFVDSQNSRFLPQTILLANIETVMAGESGTGDPAIMITIAPETRDDATQSLDLTFSQWEAEEREPERDDWVGSLKNCVASAREDAKRSEIKSPGSAGMEDLPGSGSEPERQHPGVLSKNEAEIPESEAVRDNCKIRGDSAADLPGVRAENGNEKDTGISRAVPPENRLPLSGRFHPPSPGPSGKFPLLAVIGILCIVIGITAGVFFFSATDNGKSGIPVTPVTTVPSPVPPATTIPHPTETPGQIPTAEQTEIMTQGTPTQPQFVIPPTGVWVHVEYLGNYTGSYGTSGRMHSVTISGDHIYQIPAQNETVEAMFQKLDGSGNILILEVYKNGIIVGKDATSAPMGTIDLHIDLSKV